MKIKNVLLALYCLLIGTSLWAQPKNGIPPPDTLRNSSVYTTRSLCNTIWLGVFDAQTTSCIDGQTKLYYSISFTESFQLGVGPSLNYWAYNYAGTANINTSYKIYGPFNPTDDYETSVASNIAPVLESGASGTGSRNFNSNVIAGKLYIIEITAYSCSGRIQFGSSGGFSCANQVSCESCLPKFQPIGRKVFVVSAWVKEEVASANGEINYTASVLRVTSGTNTRVLTPKGQIIDGWQRIEDTITTNTIGNLKIECMVSSGTSYFDDIRVFPYDGTMITYVYDPVTLRLAAELDERNYAKIYEYDEEGKLVRIKQETEKGIMTIQENRENSSTTVPGY